MLRFGPHLLGEVTSTEKVEFYTQEYKDKVFKCISILSEEYPPTVLSILIPHNGTGTPKGIGIVDEHVSDLELNNRLAEILEENIEGFLSRFWSVIPVTKIKPGYTEEFHTRNSFCYMQNGRIYEEV